MSGSELAVKEVRCGRSPRENRETTVWIPKRLADMTTVQKIKEIEDEMVINIMFWNYKDLGY